MALVLRRKSERLTLTDGSCFVLKAGGNWNNESNCGSRTRNANNSRSNVNANNGGRRRIRGVTTRLDAKPCQQFIAGKIHYCGSGRVSRETESATVVLGAK